MAMNSLTSVVQATLKAMSQYCEYVKFINIDYYPFYHEFRFYFTCTKFMEGTLFQLVDIHESHSPNYLPGFLMQLDKDFKNYFNPLWC